MNEKLITEQNLSHVATSFRAISHPIRIDILRMFTKNKVMNVTAIQNQLKIEQAAVSHHLHLLLNTNVVEKKRDGKNSNYYLAEGALQKIEDTLKMWN